MLEHIERRNPNEWYRSADSEKKEEKPTDNEEDE